MIDIISNDNGTLSVNTDFIFVSEVAEELNVLLREFCGVRV